ncbi:BzdS [Azoarcus sp. CIB]|nr:BzdS [Azoarcus sp. CIB]AKU11508.1 BzdS [Azoarcus sp. CIB]
MFPAMTEGSAMSTKKTIPIKLASAVREEDVEERLLREGWKRLTTIGEPRLSEIAEAYRGMGFEVHVESYKTEGDGCTTCLDTDQEMGKVIGTVYTRRSTKSQQEDELF